MTSKKVGQGILMSEVVFQLCFISPSSERSCFLLATTYFPNFPFTPKSHKFLTFSSAIVITSLPQLQIKEQWVSGCMSHWVNYSVAGFRDKTVHNLMAETKRYGLGNQLGQFDVFVQWFCIKFTSFLFWVGDFVIRFYWGLFIWIFWSKLNSG